MKYKSKPQYNHIKCKTAKMLLSCYYLLPFLLKKKTNPGFFCFALPRAHVPWHAWESGPHILVKMPRTQF